MSFRRGFIIAAILFAVVGCTQQQAQEPLELEHVQIVERLPGVSANSVPVESRVTATFNVDMNPDTITADTLTLRVNMGPTVSGDVAYDAITRTATLTPADGLVPDTVYVATVTADVRSANGGTLGGVATPIGSAWAFLTSEAGSTAPLVGGPYASSTTTVDVVMAPLSPNVSGGTPPYAFAISAGALPPGVALDPTTGIISGTPAAVGLFVGTVRVTDDEGTVAGLAFDIEVTAEIVVPGPLVGSAYAASSTVVGSAMAPLSPNVSGGTTPYAFAVTAGVLPPGVALDAATGVISGTPTAVGSFPGTVRVTDDAGEVADLAYDIEVTAEIVVPGPLVGSAYAASSTVVGSAMVPLSPNVSGGTTPYAFAVTAGVLPPGVALDAATGVISGTPTAVGSFPGTVRVTDDAGEVADLPFELVVTPAPPPPPKLRLSYMGTPYSYVTGAAAEIVPASDVVVLNATGAVIFTWELITEGLNDANWILDGATGAIRRQAIGGRNNFRPERNGDRTYLVTVEDELGETARFLVAFEEIVTAP